MPFQLRATVTHLVSNWPDRTAAAVVTFSVMALSQARPAAGSRNVKNSYRAASAGERWIENAGYLRIQVIRRQLLATRARRSSEVEDCRLPWVLWLPDGNGRYCIKSSI